jgi:hypothetical protein
MAALTIAGTGSAVAEYDSSREARVIDDEWVMSIGGYLVDFKTTAGVGSGNLIGTIVRLEDQLGLESDKTFLRGDGFYRFNERHAIGFGFWSLKREGFTGIIDEITWDGITYDAGALIESKFDVSWFRADWRYSFMRMERGEAGLNLGLSFYDLSAALRGIGTIDPGGPNEQTGTFEGEESIAVPVPTFGLFVNFAITPNVLFKSSFNWLDLEIGDIEGEVSDISLLFEWYFSEHVGIGGGAARTSIDYRDTGKNPFTLEYKQTGFLAYFTFAWGDVD